tara:strand:- start:417 stop:935 length:519 start_codon:yes stop_codon:yes gene_type:complete
MYPYFRLLKLICKSTFTKKGNPEQITSSLKIRVWPHDLDPFLELNNGRYVTLLDLGRFDFVLKIKLHRLLKRKKWSLTVAGTYNEYRHRIKLFQQFTLKTSIIGYDNRWFYFLQKAERNGKIHFSSVVKTAFTSKDGLVSAETAIKEMKLEHLKFSLPDWIHPLTNQEIIKK